MNLYQELKQNIAGEIMCAVATVVNTGTGSNGTPSVGLGGAEQVEGTDILRIGAKMLVYPDGRSLGNLGHAQLNEEVRRDSQRLMQVEKPENRMYRGGIEIFIDVFAPKPKLIIFGGVHAAIPLMHFAQVLGFRVTIVDGRNRFATRERFPTADEILVAWPEEAIAQMKIDSSTYIAILTHDPKFDIPALQALSTTTPRYIGSLGSRETRQQHFAELRKAGVSDEFLSHVHGPIGLDLGARSPEEIALAIIAEIVAVRYGRSGGFLKEGSRR